jgi:hypothetical protein
MPTLGGDPDFERLGPEHSDRGAGGQGSTPGEVGGDADDTGGSEGLGFGDRKPLVGAGGVLGEREVPHCGASPVSLSGSSASWGTDGGRGCKWP